MSASKIENAGEIKDKELISQQKFKSGYKVVKGNNLYQYKWAIPLPIHEKCSISDSPKGGTGGGGGIVLPPVTAEGRENPKDFPYVIASRRPIKNFLIVEKICFKNINNAFGPVCIRKRLSICPYPCPIIDITST